MESPSIPKWVSLLANARQTYLKPLLLQQNYESVIYDIFEGIKRDIERECGTNVGDLVGIFPIADEEQTAFASCTDNEAALFFDIGQTIILKSAFTGLLSKGSEVDIFRLFQASAALNVARKDGFYADKFGDSWSVLSTNEEMVRPDLLSAGRAGLAKVVQPESREWYSLIVDASIISHEIYHYLVSRGLAIRDIELYVDEVYEQAVDVAANDISAFNVDSISPEGRVKYAKEREIKRAHYLSRKSHLSEEIGCDVFSFIKTFDIVAQHKDDDVFESNHYLPILALFFVSFNFHLLHLAFLDIVGFYREHPSNEIRKNAGSTFNLRRIAVQTIACDWVAGILENRVNNDGNDAPGRAEISRDLQEFLNTIYLALSNDIFIPTTAKLMNCIRLVESAFPDRDASDALPIADASERLRISDLMSRLDSKILESTLKKH